MSNKQHTFKRTYVIEVSGVSRKHPEDEMTFSEENFNFLINAIVATYNNSRKTCKAEIIKTTKIK